MTTAERLEKKLGFKIENRKLYLDDECYGTTRQEVALWNALLEAERWIPVGERLPENKDLAKFEDSFEPRYYVWRRGRAWMAERAENNWWGIVGILDGVTHWKPLPESPEGE